jgi:hypothetical protein
MAGPPGSAAARAMRRLLTLLLALPSAAAPPAVQVTHGLVKLRPGDHLPPLGALFVAQNEYESIQVAVGSLSSATTVTAVGVKSPTLPRLEVAVHRQALINITSVSNCEGAAGLWPDALVPDTDVYAQETRNAFPAAVAAGERVLLWIDLFVSPGCPPGNHTVHITVETTEASEAGSQHATAVVAVVPLEVGAFSLPSTATLATAFGALSEAERGHALPSGGEKALQLVPRYVDAMLMHRLSGDFLKTEQDRLHDSFEGWRRTWGSFLDSRDLPFGLNRSRVTTQSIPAPFCVETTPVVLPHETKVAGENCSHSAAAAANNTRYWRQLWSDFSKMGWEHVLFDYTVDEPQCVHTYGLFMTLCLSACGWILNGMIWCVSRAMYAGLTRMCLVRSDGRSWRSARGSSSMPSQIYREW